MTNYEYLLNKFGYCEARVGRNSNNQNCIISIDEEAASIRTLQDNRWSRINIYWKDGTEEELYEK